MNRGDLDYLVYVIENWSEELKEKILTEIDKSPDMAAKMEVVMARKKDRDFFKNCKKITIQFPGDEPKVIYPKEE